MTSEDRLFFIVGRGRSGTTLLASLLGGHPRIFVAPESLFVMNSFRRYRRARWSPPTVRRFLEDLWREERMKRWRLDPEALETRLLAEGSTATLARLCSLVYRACAEGHGRLGPLLLGDKNPHYALFVGELLSLFPEARFLHLIRDYRDNVLSYRGVAFDLSSLSALAYRWRRFNEEVVAGSRGHEDRFLVVRYEDLVLQPTETLKPICEFLGTELVEAMLAPPESRPEAALPWHQNLGQPLDAMRIGKWRERLPPCLVARLDQVCQPFARRFGYLPAGEAIGRWEALRNLPGLAAGRLLTSAERLLFRLPLELRTTVIHAYRLASGNRIS